MTQAETRSIGYGIAASLALHILVFVGVGIWMGLSAMERLVNPSAVVEEEPEVTLLYADAFQVVPPAPPPTPREMPKQERYVRTTQNAESDTAPENPDFISDRNTVASAKLPATPGGDATMPTVKGIEDPTFELANRESREGDTKNDSAPAANPAPPSPPMVAATPPPPLEVPKPIRPEEKPPTPEPDKPEVAKKQDSPAEKMMQELDEKLREDASERLPLEVRLPEKPEIEKEPAPDEPPQMQAPDQLPVPKVAPVPPPIPNAPNPEKDAFQPQTRVGKVAGGLDKNGTEDSFSAAATPKGRYMRKVTSAIEKKWHTLSRMRADAVQPGRLRVLFRVNKDGKIKPEDVKILFNKANPLLTDFTLTAILEAQIPPIPAELLPSLDQERVEIEYEFVIY